MPSLTTTALPASVSSLEESSDTSKKPQHQQRLQALTPPQTMCSPPPPLKELASPSCRPVVSLDDDGLMSSDESADALPPPVFRRVQTSYFRAPQLPKKRALLPHEFVHNETNEPRLPFTTFRSITDADSEAWKMWEATARQTSRPKRSLESDSDKESEEEDHCAADGEEVERIRRHMTLPCKRTKLEDMWRR